MESYQDINKKIRKIFKVRNQEAAPFVGSHRTRRQHLIELFNTLGYKVGAEIGVARGLHAKKMCYAIPGVKLFLIDPWKGYLVGPNILTDEEANERYNLCVERLKKFNVEYIIKPSMEAVTSFEDNSLDFVYIDGNHEFDHVMADIIFWSQKVRPGGIVSGHDYYEFPQAGIIPAVRAYVTAHSIHDWYVTRDKEPSFFWVKK
jgi:hypothetical protein